jgi:arylsulfatase
MSMNNGRRGAVATSIAYVLLAGTMLGSAAQGQTLDRTVLPIQLPAPATYSELDVRNAKPPARIEIKAPAGAPNVLLILLDDMGFGQSSAFGGPIKMRTAEALAGAGVRFNQFHTTALCSPTRAALLSGRNHHVSNMGAITELATAFPGNSGQKPASVAPVA